MPKVPAAPTPDPVNATMRAPLVLAEQGGWLFGALDKSLRPPPRGEAHVLAMAGESRRLEVSRNDAWSQNEQGGRLDGAVFDEN